MIYVISRKIFPPSTLLGQKTLSEIGKSNCYLYFNLRDDFSAIFKFNYIALRDKRNDYKANSDQIMSNLDYKFKKIGYEKIAFTLEVECSTENRLSIRNEDTTKQLKYTKSLLKNKSIYNM